MNLKKCATILAVLVGFLIQLTAQSVGPAELPSVAEIEERIAKLDEVTDAGELAGYRELLDLRAQIDAAGKEARVFSEGIKAVPIELKKIEAKLFAMQESVSGEKDLLPVGAADATLEELEAMAKQARADAKAASSRRDSFIGEISRRQRRLDEIPNKIVALRASLADLPVQVEGVEVSELDLMKQTGARQLLEETLVLVETEKEFYREGAELMVEHRDLASLENDVLGKMAAALSARVDGKRAEIAEKSAEEAEILAKDTGLMPALAVLAEENAALANMRTGADGLVVKIRLANLELERTKAVLDRTKRNRTDAEQQVELIESAGLELGEKMGTLLRKDKAQLPRLIDIQADVRSEVEDLTSARLETVRLENLRRDEVADIDREVGELVSEIGVEYSTQAREILLAKRGYLDDLIRDYGAYTDAVRETLTTRRELILLVGAYSDFIEQRVLWIRSAPPLHQADFSVGLESLDQLFSVKEWGLAFKAIVGDVFSNPVAWLLGVGVLAYLIRYRRRYKRLLREQGDLAAKRNCRSYTPTLKAAWYTILVALPLPMLIGFVYWRSHQVMMTESWGQMICAVMRAIWFPAAAITIARSVCRPRGLAQCHLGMGSETAQLLFRGFTWGGVLVVPLVFFREAFAQLGFEAGSRICFIGSMLVIGVFALRVVRRTGTPGAGQKPSLWSIWSRPVSIFLAMLAMILVVAAYLGYFYTVVELAWRVRLSVWLILAVAVVAALVMRLLVISRRRVEFAQRLAAFRAAQAERVKEEGGDANVGVTGPNIAEIEAGLVDIVRVKAQTESLIRMSAVLLIVFGLWRVWVEVTPSLKVLDTVELWSTGASEVQSSGGSGDGSGILTIAAGEAESEKPVGWQKIIPNREVKRFVSLADLGLAILTLFLTYFAARNVPALLEITFLHRFKLMPGGAYTVMTLVRYVIVLIGIITAFAYVDVSWGKVQWIAAAITLGIGFGLQEVFANFVAGLILLFERPIRLGDFVTVGGVNGTVTQIRMRATTIRSRGNRELLVPNKEFITGQLVNWTLTDVVIRIEVPVGIAYGSDTELARDLLLEVAMKHPVVLADPAPDVVFKAFGASSLDFEVRVFVRGADSMVVTASDLHFEIDRVFRAAGIEIAFPQQDLHIRSVPEGMILGKKESDDPK